MSAKDIAFYIGETWTILGVANQADGTPLDLTGGSIEIRIASPTALVFRSQSSDFTIATGTSGAYKFNVPANDARQNGIAPNIYEYEVDVLDALGGVSTQNTGKVMLKANLRKRFP